MYGRTAVHKIKIKRGGEKGRLLSSVISCWNRINMKLEVFLSCCLGRGRGKKEGVV